MTELRMVVFREGRLWLAQGLEHDIGVQADNLKDLVARLEVALEREPVAELPPAPRYFQDLWPSRAGSFTPDRAPDARGLRIEWGMVA